MNNNQLLTLLIAFILGCIIHQMMGNMCSILEGSYSDDAMERIQQNYKNCLYNCRMLNTAPKSVTQSDPENWSEVNAPPGMRLHVTPYNLCKDNC